MTETAILPVTNVDRQFKLAAAGHPAIHENVAWFATGDQRLLGVVVRDRYDDDFGWITLRQDRAGRYRAFDLEVSHPTVAIATNRLHAALRRWATVAEDQLPAY